MSSKLWALLLLLGVLACSSLINAQSKIGYNQVLSHLGNFQTTSGGFRNAEGQETVDATSSALLLSSLYGLNAKINTVEAAKYLASLENKDGGYAKVVGTASDVESTRHALAGLARLGNKAANPESTAAYLKGHFDPTKATLRTTALALQAYELLGIKVPQDTLTGAKAALKKATATLSEDVSEIYYGVLASSLVGNEVSADTVARTILNLQSPQGLFYTDTSKRATSITATTDAMLALNALGPKYVDSINTAALRAATRYVPLDIESSADAHLALAVTKAFRDNFVVSTGAAPGSVIVEGTGVRPSVSISAKESGGVSHSGFQVSSKHTFHKKESTKAKLTWNADTQSYSGEPLTSTGNFGPFESVYTLSAVIPGVGPISFDVTDTKNIGYGIVVNSKATIELSGREVREGEQVTTGTDFTFAVALSSSANNKLLTGNYVATFSVLDSSEVILHQSTVDGSDNKAPISFTYKLVSSDVPAGQLSFQFDVASKSGVIHTTRTIAYSVAVAMVAANINFDQKVSSYKIGDTVKLSMEPTTFPDLRTPHALSTKDARNSDATASRHFFLDVKSPQGLLLRTVEGDSTKSTIYTFTIPVEATFASIGVNTLSFRYKPTHGPEIQLQNFDSSVGELYEDINVLNYTVKADLALVDVTEKPRVSDLVYGDSVVFKFRVKDTASGKYLVSSSESPANVFLELQHSQDKEKSSRPSVFIPTVATRDQITANWTINPNAHKGKGVLTLAVQDNDGKKIPLKDAVSLPVTIGGEITVEPHTISTSPLDYTSTAFVVELGLFCKDKPLQDAQLHANVVYGDKDEVLATLPVAHNGGRYTVSWSSPNRATRSGTYKVNFYREVDRQLALEKRDQKEKADRKTRVAGEGSLPLSTAELQVDPIFTVSVSHSAPRFTKLPVKAEFAALMIFGGIVVWLVNKRSNLK